MKNLDHLLELPNPWRGDLLTEQTRCTPTGYDELDGLLPERGWVQGALTELLVARDSIGALQLVLPALARLSQEPRWIAWVAPPFMPYVPALEAAGVNVSRLVRVYPRPDGDGLGAIENCLRAGTCSAVLAWPVACELQVLRRLQRAAAQGDAWGILFRHEQHAMTGSPVSQRLHVAKAANGVSVTSLDPRGEVFGESVAFSYDRLLQTQATSYRC